MHVHALEEGKVKVELFGVTSRSPKGASNFSEEIFSGELVLIGNLLCIFASARVDGVDRVRTIFFPRSIDSSKMETTQWGIAAGYSSRKSEPVAARILMSKNQTKICDNASKRQSFLCFRNLEEEEVRLRSILSNDIKNDHVSHYEDYVLTTSYQDVLETIDRSTIQKINDAIKKA